MTDILIQLFPNYARTGSEFIKSIMETLQMLALSGGISFLIGTFFGVVLIVTRKEGIMENKLVYSILDKVINIIRSIPFLILIVMLFPLSRMIVGTAIGVKGAIVPLIIGTVPFFARQIESAIAEVDLGLIEAAQSMGSSPLEIIFRVYLRESVPSIARVTMVTAVNLIGLTAMAGAVGAGGLGDFAIRYGHQLKMWDMVFLTVIVILMIVTVIQAIGNLIIKRTTH